MAEQVVICFSVAPTPLMEAIYWEVIHRLGHRVIKVRQE